MLKLYTETASEDVVLIIAQEDVSVDLATVDSTGCTMQVRLPDGSTKTWAAVVTDQSSASITLTHTLAADGTDVGSVAGEMLLYARLPVTTGGIYRTDTISFPVLDAFDNPF